MGAVVLLQAKWCLAAQLLYEITLHWVLALQGLPSVADMARGELLALVDNQANAFCTRLI